MKFIDLKKNISKLLYFNKQTLRKFEGSENNLNTNIKNWLKREKVIALKKGVYILRNKFESEPNKDLYMEYLANQLIRPSYISADYVLAKYDILSEPVSAITSVTVKITREIINPIGTFRYYSILPELYKGFNNKPFNGAIVFEASKEKALFDYLYFRFLKIKKIDDEYIINLRINWENITKREFIGLYEYLPANKSRKIKKAFDLIKNEFYA